jgi:hypothetical protein
MSYGELNLFHGSDTDEECRLQRGRALLLLRYNCRLTRNRRGVQSKLFIDSFQAALSPEFVVNERGRWELQTFPGAN